MKRGPRNSFRKVETHPTVSLCMIVKNEAQTLEKCLCLARPHVDEIVVVDTGSTDGSQEIARRYADVFEEIEWPDSFAIARNYSFDMAGSDFILILDGDEYIPNTAHWQRIRESLKTPGLCAVQILVRNVMRDHHLLAADCLWQERIIRNHPLLRYEGMVHNQIAHNIRAHMERFGSKLARAEAEVIHVGYALQPDALEKKYAARLHLLQKEYAEPSFAIDRAYYGYQLAVAYFLLKRYQEALGVLDEINYAGLIAPNAFHAHLVAGQAALLLQNAEAAMNHINALFALDRSEPISYFLAAYALLATGRESEGILMLGEAFRLNGSPSGAIRFPLNDAQLFFFLGEVCEKAGLHSRACFFFSRYLDHHPDDQKTVERVGVLDAQAASCREAAA